MITGPTAVGKTDLAIELAKHYKTVILSADSRQFYKELEIGTAKPTANQLKEIKHYFINNKNITELYGAGHYEKDVVRLLEELFKEFNLVIMVGGSGLYINAVLKGVDEFEEIPPETRDQLNKEFLEKGLGWLQEEVKRHDPDYYKIVDINNPQRLLRALEVVTHTNKPFSGYLKKAEVIRPFIPVKILLNPERKILYERINNRVDEMMKNGLLEEATRFKDHKHHNALKTVGYNELYDYLDGKITLKEAVEKIKQHTRNFAKRQVTWFKNKETFEEFTGMNKNRIISYIDSLIKK